MGFVRVPLSFCKKRGFWLFLNKAGARRPSSNLSQPKNTVKPMETFLATGKTEVTPPTPKRPSSVLWHIFQGRAFSPSERLEEGGKPNRPCDYRFGGGDFSAVPRARMMMYPMWRYPHSGQRRELVVREREINARLARQGKSQQAI